MKRTYLIVLITLLLIACNTYIIRVDAATKNSIDKNKELPNSLFNFLQTDEYINTDPNTLTPTPSNPQNGTPAQQPTLPVDGELPPAQNSPGCPTSSSRVHVAGRYRHLNRSLPCDTPRMLVVHWSAGWSSAQATFDVLNNRDRSCQFAIDDNEIIQMLDFYPNAVERGWCAGGESNVGSINFEITGAWFDEVLLQSNEKNRKLMIMTNRTVDLSCKLIRMYNIPKTAIYGHYQLQSGKADPGIQYLNYFKQLVNQRC